MKCTACKQGNLHPAYFDGLFKCHRCDHCGGELILMGDYMRWQELNPDAELTPKADLEIEAQETSRAMICPLSGVFMTKYRISADTDHRLDLSSAINAVWLDAGEWELLKQNGLAGRLNDIFSDNWQRQILETERYDTLAELNAEKFGEHFEAIEEFKSLLATMPNRLEVLAYLHSR